MNVKPLAVAALLAMTTSVWAAPAVQSVDRVLAVVDKQVITLGEFQDAVKRNRAALPKGSPVTDQQLQSQTLSNLVDHALMVQMAARTGIQVSDAEIKQNLGLVSKQADMSDKQWQTAVRDELLVEKLKQRDLYSKVRVSDADITQAIDSLPEKDKKQSSGHTVTAYYPQHILIAAVRDEHDQTTHYVATINDISAYKAAEEKVHLLAFYDSLTKLPNRSLFLEHLEQSMRDTKNKKQLGAVLLIDLDNFKAINDTAGHETGDYLLQQVATRLLECVEANQMVARLGSDEFVVLLDHLGSSEMEAIPQLEKTAKYILQTLTQPYFLADSEYHNSASIGISLFGIEACENIQDPIKRADMALSDAKNYGRNTYRFFDPEIQSQVQERAEIDTGLRQALEKNQLVLYYQPQVNGAQQVTGVEALLRWLHPVKGMISPARFIPVAEENGFIITLGQWVLESACQQLSDWAKYPQTAHLSMAVNVSASQFARDEFVQDVLDVLERTQAPAHLLKLELTESALVMRVEDIIEKMTILKRYGIMFSLDDFGTGYSSLTYLQRIPIDQLKIDQGFVRNIVISANDAEIAKMIIV